MGAAVAAELASRAELELAVVQAPPAAQLTAAQMPVVRLRAVAAQTAVRRPTVALLQAAVVEAAAYCSPAPMPLRTVPKLPAVNPFCSSRPPGKTAKRDKSPPLHEQRAGKVQSFASNASKWAEWNQFQSPPPVFTAKIRKHLQVLIEADRPCPLVPRMVSIDFPLASATLCKSRSVKIASEGRRCSCAITVEPT
jgi:hypothetical protein